MSAQRKVVSGRRSSDRTAADANARIQTHEEVCAERHEQIRTENGYIRHEIKNLHDSVKDIPVIAEQTKTLITRMNRLEYVLYAIAGAIGLEFMHFLFSRIA